MINKYSGLCKENEESIDHILIHYEKIRVISMFLSTVFGLKQVWPTSMRNLFKWKFKGLDIAPLCFSWCVWK